MTDSADIQKIPFSDRTVTFTLKKNAFNIFDESSEDLWTFDLSGRPVGLYVDDVNYRRTLDNRFLVKSRFEQNGSVFRDVTPVSMETAWPKLQQGLEFLKTAESSLPDSFQGIIKSILSITPETLAADAQRFRRIYKPVSILPPDQYMALVVQMTEGCNYNKCLFCNFYRDRRFLIKSGSDFRHHLQQIRKFFSEGLSMRKSIFLADANALVTPMMRLIPMMAELRSTFPELGKVYSFIDVFTGMKKTTEDFCEIRSHGLQRVYLGVESGNPELLQFLRKPQLEPEIVSLAENLKSAGIQLGVILLAGAGGVSCHEKHLRDSVQLVRKLPLSRGDLVYISEFYQTNPEYQTAMAESGYPIPNRFEIRSMADELRAAVKDTVPQGAAVPVYDIQQFLY